MDVGHLQVDEGVHVRDLVLPPDVTVKADPELLLAHVVLRAVGGLSNSEIASELGTSADTVRVWLSRARRQVAASLAPTTTATPKEGDSSATP